MSTRLPEPYLYSNQLAVCCQLDFFLLIGEVYFPSRVNSQSLGGTESERLVNSSAIA